MLYLFLFRISLAFHLVPLDKDFRSKGYDVKLTGSGVALSLNGADLCQVDLLEFPRLKGSGSLYKLHSDGSLSNIEALAEGDRLVVSHPPVAQCETMRQLKSKLKKKGAIFKFRLTKRPWQLPTRRDLCMGFMKGLFLLFIMLWMVIYFCLLNHPRAFGNFLENFSPADYLPNISSFMPTLPRHEHPIEVFCGRITSDNPFNNIYMEWLEEESKMKVGYSDLDPHTAATVAVTIPDRYRETQANIYSYIHRVITIACKDR